jgi:hypothetical protein
VSEEKKKEFSPHEQACADSIKTGWLGDKHFDIEAFGTICKRRGLVTPQIWSPKNLSLPLIMFEKESRSMEEEKIDLLLHNLAVALALDENLVKREFYAIRQNWEDQFLSDLDKEEQKRRKLEELAQEAENEALSPKEESEEPQKTEEMENEEE